MIEGVVEPDSWNWPDEPEEPAVNKLPIEKMCKDAHHVLKHGHDNVLRDFMSDLAHHTLALADECERLKECIAQIAQIRHICGNAQAHMRNVLRMVDAALTGADLRKIEVVKAVAEGKWRP